MITAYIGLGSNLNDPIKQVKTALIKLAELPSTSLLRHSQLYWSESLLSRQPRYCNAVAEMATELAAEQLLNELQLLESKQGRVRAEKWGPRIIDLDIMLYGGQTIQTERLHVPHSQLMKRDFWLYPLAELNPGLILPGDDLLLKDRISNKLPIGLEIIAK